MLDNVSKDYKSKNNIETNSLKNVNIRIKQGEFVFIIGDSGAGKSTLLKLLMREISPTEGKVYVNGKNLKRLRHSQIAKHRRNIGMVFQDFRLLKDRSVFENIAFAMQIVEKTKKQINDTVPRMLEIVGLNDKAKSYPKELSGGEQQRVALARALVNEPIILLADEPTGNLDPKNSWEIMNLLEEVNRRGTTVVVVTHNIEIVKTMDKRVIELKNGEIVSDWMNGADDEDSDFDI
ncbi:MAG: cell division ATP-binding protein FtsE [Catonella sp.]|uniref:cell division ATP-binding protein FtsE n=1 Tax=Catonella sp. TaxID=2382125 RepID=UPI003FA0BEBE